MPKPHHTAPIIPMLAQESLYVGIDVGKHRHIAGFVSQTLLKRHIRFENCPILAFEQSREGFRTLVERIRAYTPIDQCFVLLEKTGHYHHALVQYLQELDVSVYLIHVQTRPKGMLKTDKRDALGLANDLYNQLDRGIQVADKLHVIRRAVPPTQAAARLRGLIRHRYELSHEATRRKNKLVAICDELFPEFTQVFKDPNLPGALAIRKQFATPHAVATASVSALHTLKVGKHPSEAKLHHLQELAASSIGIKDLSRQRGLILEQTQLIAELQLFHQHLHELDSEISQIIGECREGKILASIPGVGPIHAATILAAIGHIDNFSSAAALKSYFGWAPMMLQSGTTLDQTDLTQGGTRPAKQAIFLIVCSAIQQDCEWAKMYERLVKTKCRFDERKQEYVGKKKVIGRIAGQVITMIFALLKQDAEMSRKITKGPMPEPQIYDPQIHQAHRAGQYRPIKTAAKKQGNIIALPKMS